MPFLVTVQVQLDTEYESVAQRQREILIENLLDEPTFLAFSVSPVEPGELDVDEA